MDGYNALQNIEAQMKQLQSILNQPKPTVPTIPTIPAPQPQIMTIPFVDGIEGAKQFLKSMAANSSAAVFDKTESVFYTLSVDANGNAAPIKLGRFTVEDAPEPENNVITRADFDSFKNEIRALVAGLKEADE